MRQEMTPFLEEGVRQYAVAKDTVSAFEQAIGNSLRGAVKQRKIPGSLRNVQIGRSSVGGGSGGFGYWICLTITGKSSRGEETEIDCGVWWNCSELKGKEPIVYAEFRYKPKRLMIFPWSQARRIKSFTHYGRSFLYLPLRNPKEIEASLNLLLDALFKKLKA